MHPFLPFASEKLWQLLGYDGILAVHEWPVELAI
ncbi:MAG: class I tRNA ligase family protein [Candidatus Peribacteria bacterium]|nr:MAG: class I tRNA ligase family protein [Candidatus Peribacteria bacterium]